MASAVRRYLGLAGREDQRQDDWIALASRLDGDGFFLTPLRRAIELQARDRRLFLRNLVPELYFPTDVAALHGIPDWGMSDVIHQSLAMLWWAYLERPIPSPGYLERSDSQRAAEDGVDRAVRITAGIA